MLCVFICAALLAVEDVGGGIDGDTNSDASSWVTAGLSSSATIDIDVLVSNTLFKGEKVIFSVECTMVTALSKTPGAITLIAPN